MTKLFASHASEDKTAFVEPMVHALMADGYTVWYDKYALFVGDSLREKIDEGLRAADYGVVVLSKAFFGKKWTNAELDGLFALERKNRKLILPVWYGVTKEDVEAYSPILAGRLGADASKGVESVVNDLNRSIQAAQAQAVASEGSAADELLSLGAELASEAEEMKALRSLGSGDMVTGAINDVMCVIEAAVAQTEKQSKISFVLQKDAYCGGKLHGPYGISLTIYPDHLFSNDVTRANIVAVYSVSRDFGARTQQIDELRWRPRFLKGVMEWSPVDDAEKVISTAELAKIILRHFKEVVSEEKRNR